MAGQGGRAADDPAGLRAAPQFRRLRDLTRYRADLVAARTAEKQRAEKPLEDAQIKLSAVICGIFGVSGRDMMAALVAGEPNPKVLAQLARRTMRQKITVGEEAFTGYFTGHHAFLPGTTPGRVGAISAGITALDARIDEAVTPFASAVARLDEIPGISQTAAHVITAGTGVDMTRFATAGHLVSWARFAPGVKESAGKKNGKSPAGHGNAYRAAIVGNAAAGAAKTSTFPGERHRRIARRRGAKKAVVATGHSILVIIWHLLSDPDARHRDLGPDFYTTRIDPGRRKRNHIRQLEAPGYTVTLQPAA